MQLQPTTTEQFFPAPWHTLPLPASPEASRWSTGIQSQPGGVQIPALPAICCVTLGKRLCLSVLQFLICTKETHTHTHYNSFQGYFEDSRNNIHQKSGTHEVLNKCYITLLQFSLSFRVAIYVFSSHYFKFFYFCFCSIKYICVQKGYNAFINRQINIHWECMLKMFLLTGNMILKKSEAQWG